MLVFIDSNQFISDYWLRNASWYYLLRFLSGEEHTLLLSRLVVEEVENKFSEHVTKAAEDARKIADRLTALGVPVPKGLDALTGPQLALENRLREEVNQVALIEYNDVPHEEVVRRALARKKPFDAEGHDGYRDCLLWMSLLRYLAENDSPEDEIVFVSNNSTDFYQQAGKQVKGPGAIKDEKPGPKFHDDLAADLATLKLHVTPYESVAAFVDSKVDKALHAIDRSQKYELFEDFLTTEGLAVFNHLEQQPGSEVLKSLLGPVGGLLTVMDSNAVLFEGMEDLHLDSTAVDGSQVYVSCSYNLRIVNVDVVIPRTEAEEHRAELAASPYVWEVEEIDRQCAVRLTMRAYFDAAFLFDPTTEECSRFSLRRVRVK